MSRAIWFVAGAGAGVWSMVKARRAAEAFTPDGLTDRLAGCGWSVGRDPRLGSTSVTASGRGATLTAVVAERDAGFAELDAEAEDDAAAGEQGAVLRGPAGRCGRPPRPGASPRRCPRDRRARSGWGTRTSRRARRTPGTRWPAGGCRCCAARAARPRRHG